MRGELHVFRDGRMIFGNDNAPDFPGYYFADDPDLGPHKLVPRRAEERIEVGRHRRINVRIGHKHSLSGDVARG